MARVLRDPTTTGQYTELFKHDDDPPAAQLNWHTLYQGPSTINPKKMLKITERTSNQRHFSGSKRGEGRSLSIADRPVSNTQQTRAPRSDYELLAMHKIVYAALSLARSTLGSHGSPLAAIARETHQPRLMVFQKHN